MNNKTLARNYTIETINQNIYIFGIATDDKEKKAVIEEANKIYDVNKSNQIVMNMKISGLFYIHFILIDY